MSYCLNPECPKPQNRTGREVCRACGARLLLKDRYRAVRLIGQGGFGRTFLAIDEDKPSKPHCVIKQFLPLSQDARHVKKAADLFEREATQLEALGYHPQIPALLAHFSQDQQQYLVQEFIEGKTLIDVLQEQGPFSEAQGREVLSSLLPVLEFIHAHGVIHRDIKPPNIIATPGSRIFGMGQPTQPNWAELLQALSQEAAQGFRDGLGSGGRCRDFVQRHLSESFSGIAIADQNRCHQLALQFVGYASLSLLQRQYLVADASRLLFELRRKYEYAVREPHRGQLVLVDFGAVKMATATAMAHTGTAIGSPEYLSPEQARGKATFASDLYSLGVTCLHLLTGRSPNDLFDSHNDVWQWRPYVVAPISDRLARILDRLVEARMNRRYESATQVLQDLDPPLVLLNPEPPISLGQRQRVVPPIEMPQTAPPASKPIPPLAPEPRSFKLAVPSRPLPSGSVRTGAPSGAIAAPTVKLVPPNPGGNLRRKKSGDWEPAHTFASPGKVYAIALNAAEGVLASSSGTTIKLWDLQTGQPIRNLTGHLDLVSALVMAPQSLLLISGSADKTVKLWDLTSGQRRANLALHTDTVLAIALSPDGTTLASSSLYDPIVLLDMRTQQERDRLHGHTNRVDALAFSPDGAILASGSGDGSIKLWEVGRSRELRTLQGHSQPVLALAFSADGKTLASGSADGTVILWSTQTYRPKRTLNPAAGRVNALSFSPDGKSLMVGCDALQLWSPRNGQLLKTLNGHSSLISTIATSPASDRAPATFASASWDGTVRVWQK